MNNIKTSILKNINGLIIMLLAKGIKELSATKFLLFINEKYGIEIDQNALEEILSDNSSVSEIVDDKIMLGQSQKQEDNVDDEVHDMATDQAMNHFESFNNIKLGDKLSSNKISLSENDKDYLLHNGLKKSKVNYIVIDIVPSININESKIICKVEGKGILVEIPLLTIK